MNEIIIMGRLTKDAEIKTTLSGIEVCNFTVAVDRSMKKESEKITDFIDCTAWRKTGVFVSTYFKKGDGIVVRGSMESRKWVADDGTNRVSWGVTVNQVEFPLQKSRKENESVQVVADSTNLDQNEIEISDEFDLPF